MRVCVYVLRVGAVATSLAGGGFYFTVTFYGVGISSDLRGGAVGWDLVLRATVKVSKS